MKKDNVKQIVKKHYAEIAINDGVGCCSSGDKSNNERIAKSIGYSEKEIEFFSEANLGLGCGNPTGIGKIKEGDVVVDTHGQARGTLQVKLRLT